MEFFPVKNQSKKGKLSNKIQSKKLVLSLHDRRSWDDLQFFVWCLKEEEGKREKCLGKEGIICFVILFLSPSFLPFHVPLTFHSRTPYIHITYILFLVVSGAESRSVVIMSQEGARGMLLPFPWRESLLILFSSLKDSLLWMIFSRSFLQRFSLLWMIFFSEIFFKDSCSLFKVSKGGSSGHIFFSFLLFLDSWLVLVWYNSWIVPSYFPLEKILCQP